jgi:type III pantothenate kinase
MILVFDVGNTNTVIGVFDGSRLADYWRISTDVHRTGDEYGMLIRGLFCHSQLEMNRIKAVVISSVVPSLMMELEMMSQKFFSL